MKARYWSGFLALAAACGPPTQSDTADRLPPGASRMATEPVAELVARQYYSGLDTPARRVITDARTWSAVWSQIWASFTPAPAVPEIDFSQSTVVIAAMGNKPSGGYAVSLEAFEHDGRIYAVVLEQSPGPTCATTAAITAPMAAVRISGAGRPVTFVEKKEVVEC